MADKKEVEADVEKFKSKIIDYLDRRLNELRGMSARGWGRSYSEEIELCLSLI